LRLLKTLLVFYFAGAPLFGGIAQEMSYEHLHSKGDSFLFANNFDEAIVAFEEARIEADQQGNSFEYFLQTYKIGYCYFRQNENFLALAHFTQISLMYSPKTPEDSALYYLSFLEELVITQKAIIEKFSEKELENIIAKGGYLNSHLRKRYMYVLGGFFMQRLEYPAAKANFQESVNIKTKDTFLEENSWYYLGWVYEQLMEHNRAIECYGYLLSRPLSHIKPELLYYYLGNNYSLLKQWQPALQYFTASIEGYQGTKYASSVYMELGNCYKRLGRIAEAEEKFMQALNIAEEYREEPEFLVIANLSLGYLYKLQGKRSLTKKYYELAHDITIRESVEFVYTIQVIDLLASYYYEVGELSKALKLVNSFLEKHKETPLWNENNTAFNYYINVLADQSEIYVKQWENTKQLDNLEKALQSCSRLIDESLRWYNNLSSEKTKLYYQSKIRSNLELSFEIAYSLYEVTGKEMYFRKLIEYDELSKSNIFKANLNRNQTLVSQGVSSELIRRESELRQQTSRIRYYLNEKSSVLNDSVIKTLKIELAETQSSLDSLMKVIKKGNRNFTDFTLTAENKINTNIKDYLLEDQILINYFLTKNALYILSFDQKVEHITKVDLESDFIRDIIKLRNKIMVPSGSYFQADSLKSFIQLSNSLYIRLLHPIKNQIKGKRLVVIPDKEINLIPFEVLLTDTIFSRNAGFDQFPFLLHSNSVSVLNTKRQLVQSSRKKILRTQFVGFAPDYSIHNRKSNNLVQFVSLPGAEKEVINIKDFYKGKAYLEKEATKEAFMRNATKADIMHLAMHTNLSDMDPMNSQLVFSVSKNDSTGLFYTWELYGTHMNADLVVLSACNTGSGEISSGEGLLNLTRGFFYSGVQNVVATQWAVTDGASASLVNYFYKNLAEGVPADLSLQQAKIEFLQKEDPLKHHPYYWAGYVSFGKPATLSAHIPFKWLWILPILLIVAVYLKIKKR
jgi:CHAT domain-containing protein/tetratricopeptide (TPR) repeat protein